MAVTFELKATDGVSAPAKAAADYLRNLGDEASTASPKIDAATNAQGGFASAADKAAKSAIDAAAGNSQLASAAARAALAVSSANIVLGLGVAGVIAYVAAYAKGAGAIDTLNRSLVSTGNFAGTTALALSHLSSEIGAQTGAYRDAEQALNKLAGGGKLAGDGLTNAAKSAVALSQITGDSIDKSVAEFEKLADKPVKAALELNDKYHFLTLAVYDQIKALQDQGKEQEATDAALDASAKVFESRREKIVDNMGLIARAAKDAKEFVLDLADAVSSVGKDATLQTQIDALYAKRGAAQTSIDQIENGSFGFLRSSSWKADAIGALLVQQKGIDDTIAKLREQQSAQDAVNRAANDQQHAEQLRVKAAADIDDLSLKLDKQAEKQAAINKLNADFNKLAAGGTQDPRLTGVTQNDQGNFSGGLYDKLLADINKKYEVKKPVDHDAIQDEQALKEVLAQANKEVNDALALNDKLADGYNGPWAQAQEQYAKSIDTITKGLIGLRTEFNLGVITAEQYAGGQKTFSDDAGKAADKLAAAQKKIADSSNLTNGNPDLVKQLDAQRDILAGLTPAQIAYNKAVEDAHVQAQKLLDDGRSQQEVDDGLADKLQKLAQLRDNAPVISLVEQFGQKSEWDQLQDNIKATQDALVKAMAAGGVGVESLTRLLGNLNQQGLEKITGNAQAGLRALQSLTKDGSEAFQAMQIAIDALTLANAIGVIVNQGFGDPYTAFARMAAMAAAIGQLGVDISNFGGGGPDPNSAAERQKTQGTGSVLGDATAQSDSIAKAINITADATTQLVGLNRGMLTALQALQNALGAAGNQLARGAGNATFPGLHDANYGLLGPLGQFNPLLDKLTSDPIGSAIGSFVFGGKQKVIDQGIQIFGGTLNDVLNKVVVGAYQTVHSSGGLLGSGSTKDNIVGVSDDFNKQFQLVITSIVDTVKAGATALGLLPADIQAKIDVFQLAATKISLQGLSADDQQKALEAVFSKIFDDLAGAVVPFIGQFQQVGEGLGETLVRVATEVQVAQEAFKQLGISVDETDPEKFAQIADGLVQAAGGLDDFISSMQSFVDKFAPDSAKFRNDFESLTSGLSQVGLTLPSTREGMYALMQSLDATTAAGREQIATLLKLTDTSDAYYSGLEQQAQSATSYSDFIAGLVSDSGALSSFAKSRLTIEQWERDTIKQANELAKAAGLQGASEQDLTLIHEVAAQKIADAISQLQSATQDLVDKLYHNGQSVADSTDTATSAVAGFGHAMTSVAEAASAAAQLLLGDLSPLNDTQKLQYALQAFNNGVIGKSDVLDIAHRLYGSSQPYVDLFNSLANRPDPSTGGAGGGGSVGSVRSAQETAAQRHADAQTIAQNVASLANAQKESYEDVAKSLHLNLSDLAKDLGLSNDDLTKYLDNAVAADNAIPDSLDGNTNRIIAAMYDIAGLPPPTDPVNDGGTTLNGVHGGRGGTATTFGANSDTTTTVTIPRGHSGHAMPVLQPQASMADPETAGLLRDVRGRLDIIIAATKSGTGEVVSAVREVAEATDGVSHVISRGNAEMAATKPRGRRP